LTGLSTPNRLRPASKGGFKRFGRCVPPRFCRVRGAKRAFEKPILTARDHSVHHLQHRVAGGIHRVHGLRHQYAQARYQELTGLAAPADGGPRSRTHTPEQKQIDSEARLATTRELGHDREQVTAIYLGR
jgi:hypothetical protein